MFVEEDEAAVGLYVVEGGGEGALFVAVGGRGAEAVEEGGVAGMERFGMEWDAKQLGGVSKGVADGGEQLGAVYLVAKDLAERDGVGGVADKRRLVDIEPYADEGAREVGSFEVVFDEDAAELMVAVVDVVGPLDVQVADVAAQYLAEHYGDVFAEEELA